MQTDVDPEVIEVQAVDYGEAELEGQYLERIDACQRE